MESLDPQFHDNYEALARQLFVCKRDGVLFQ